MTFPVVAGTARTADGSSVTSHTVNLPASIASGDLLIGMFAIGDGSLSITWPGGWTQLVADIADGSNSKTSIYYRTANGSEGSTITVTTSGGGIRAVAHVYRITGWHGTTIPELANTAEVTTSTPDPPSLNPTNWGTEDTLWIAVEVNNNGTRTASAYPTNYTGGITDGTSGGSSVSIASASRQLNAASEDPGTFTLSGGTSRTIALTIAVRPVVGTLNTQSLDGTLTSSGALVKQAGKTLAGSMGSSGGLALRPAKVVAGSMSSAGALAKRANKVLAGGALTAFDQFTGTNGDALTAHTMDTGSGWGNAQGTWTIQSNRAKMTASAGDGQNVIVTDIGQADAFVQVVAFTPASGVISAGLILNFVDNNNYWLFALAGSAVQLFERVAGTFTLRASATTPGIGGNSSVVVMRVITNGDTIDCYISDIKWMTYTGSPRGSKTGTKHGIRSFSLDNGTTFDFFAAGGILPLGLLARQENKALAGSMSSSGALVRRASKVLAGVVSSSGALARQAARSFAGSLTSAGALTPARQIRQALGGTLTSSGALVKQARQLLAGSVSSSGALSKQAQMTVGALHPSIDWGFGDPDGLYAGVPVLNTGIPSGWTGPFTVDTANPAYNDIYQVWPAKHPALVIAFLEITSGASQVAGVTWDGAAFTLLGTTVAANGRLLSVWYLFEAAVGEKVFEVTFTVSPTTQGILLDLVELSNIDDQQPILTVGTDSGVDGAASIDLGDARNNWVLQYIGHSNTTNVVSDARGDAEGGGGGSTGASLERIVLAGRNSVPYEWTIDGDGEYEQIAVAFRPSAFHTSGEVVRQSGKSLVGTLTVAGSLVNLVQQALAGALNMVGSLQKLAQKVLGGTLDASGTLTPELTSSSGSTITVGGTMDESGSTTNQAQKPLAGSVTESGTLVSAAAKRLVGTMAASGALVRQTQKILAGTVALSGSLTKRVLRAFSGTLTSSGSLITRLLASVSLSGTVSGAGTLLRTTLKQVRGTEGSVGTVRRLVFRGFTGTLTASGALMPGRQIKIALGGVLDLLGSLANAIASAPGICPPLRLVVPPIAQALLAVVDLGKTLLGITPDAVGQLVVPEDNETTLVVVARPLSDLAVVALSTSGLDVPAQAQAELAVVDSGLTTLEIPECEPEA